MGRTKQQLETGELAQCHRFIVWWRINRGENFTIVQRPNPPDFILQSSTRRTWLEVTDVFFDDEDVDWQLSSSVASRGILDDTDDLFVERFVQGLTKKLSKPSYSDAYAELGAGLLLLTARYHLIDQNLLYSLQCRLSTVSIDDDYQLFAAAYMECFLAGRWQCAIVYPTVDLIADPTQSQ